MRVTVYEITDEALFGSSSYRNIKASRERGQQMSLAIKRKEGGLVWRVMSFNPATHLGYMFSYRAYFVHVTPSYAGIKHFRPPPHSCTTPPIVFLYLNSSLTFQVYFASFNCCLPSSPAVVEVHVSALQGAFGL